MGKNTCQVIEAYAPYTGIVDDVYGIIIIGIG
jgi:hypothetical protein